MLGPILGVLASAVSPLLIHAGKMALRLVTAQALEDLVLWSIDRLVDNAKSPATKELAEIARKNLARQTQLY